MIQSRGFLNYRQEQIIDGELAGRPLRLVTRAGFPKWGHIPEAMRLLAEHAKVVAGERVLILPCGHGALGVWAASRSAAENITLCDTNVVAVQAAQRTLRANECFGAQIVVGLSAIQEAAYDVVLMTLPKGRDLWRLYFLHAFNALREGGRLYLAGANDEGIKSAVQDGAELFGSEVLLAYKRSNRVVLFARGPAPEGGLPASYLTPGIAEGTFNEFAIQVKGETYTVCTRPGVFSWRKLDAGTRLLLDVLEVRVADTVLDVGCGYGMIGMVAAKRALNGQVTLVDVDWLACECAKATLSRNAVTGAQVLLGDGLAAVAGQAFTLIVSNPPFHSGHEVNYDVVEAFVYEAYEALAPHGRLVLVANRFLPYDRLMSQIFGSTTKLAETPHYHVLSAEKSRRRSRATERTRSGMLPAERPRLRFRDGKGS